MSKEFQYSQRPFSKKLTDEQYNRAVGKPKRSKPVQRCPFVDNPDVNPFGCYVSNDGENGPSPNFWTVHGKGCPRAE